MGPNQKTARIAGVLYLVVVLTGIFSLMYVPSKLIRWDDAAGTWDNILQHETLFRLGILAGIVCYIAFLLLPMVLYALFRHVNQIWAATMVALAVTSVPISLVNLLHKVNVLTLIKQHKFMEGTDITEWHRQVMLQLEYYNNGIEITGVFWGLWLLPFGYLVYKSGFLPKLLGILLMAGCFSYLINFTGGFLSAQYAESGIARFVSIPASIGEIGICLWLLTAGINTKRTL